MSKTPKLRFKEFSGEWEEKKLGDIFDFYTTNSYSRECLNNKLGSVKNIHYGDIHMKFPTIVDVKNSLIPYINNEIDLSKVSKECYCKEGDIVIADASEDYDDIGKTIELKNVENEKVVAGLHTMLARDNKEITVNGYRGYMLLNNKIRKQIKILSVGSKVLGISKSNINKVLLNLPIKQEQQKIASFFSTLDKKVEKQQQKVESLKKYKKGMMQKIFNREIRFKDENGEDYPEWVEKKLGEVSDVRDGTHDSPKYILENKYPLITSKNLMENGKIDFNNVNYISKIDYININKRSKVDIGDILFGMIGTIGNPVIVKKEDFAIKNVALIKEKNYLKNEYLIQYLKSNVINQQFYILNAGGTQKFIALGIIRDLLILIPCLQEQQKIASFFSTLDKKIEKEEEKLNKLNEFKKGLLQQMFV